VDKVRQLLMEDRIRLATPDEVFAWTECQIGAVSPFGGAAALRRIADKSILELPHVVVGSGQSNRLVRLAGSDFGKVFRGEFGSICVNGR
jgi:prolyl-tRNA editing enzyme YbaK/EbsC (Cys-tRNA(Pro) deacylase)